MNDTGKANPSTREIYFRLPLCPLHLPHKLAMIETEPGDERLATDHNIQRTVWFQKMKSDYEPPQSKQAASKKRDTRAINVTYTAAETGVKFNLSSHCNNNADG
jgi:hypothetical protein